MNPSNRISKRHWIALLMALILSLLAAAVLSPLPAAQSVKAAEPEKIIRVGWFDSPFNKADELGRRSGLAYEYQQKIAAYTGWAYEYVEGSWPELIQMLIDGRIDLLSDVSFAEERVGKILYSSLPMGKESYCLFKAPDNDGITLEDFSSFKGKKVGVNKGSIQMGLFREWAEANGAEVSLIELTGSEDENITLLNRGEIDLYVALEAVGKAGYTVPVCMIGSSDIYFALSVPRSDLLPQLNAALSLIQDENEYYNQQLNAKYIKTSSVNYFLSPEEKEWLAGHGTIRVGYQDNYLAFCASDPRTGELTGALKDYLQIASDSFQNAQVDFEALPFPNAQAALEAMKKGEVDCVFPANLTDYDGEVQGFFMTPPLMRTDMSAVIRAEDQYSFTDKDRVAVAVNSGNPNYDMFLLDHFPDWRAIYYTDTAECLKAIAEGQADCLLISNYRYNNIADLCRRYNLTTFSTGEEMDYCIAVKRQDTTLYTILSKITGVVPPSSVNSSLSYYYTEDAKVSFGEFVRENQAVILVVLTALALVIVLLLHGNAQMKKKALAEQRLIQATEVDPISGLYNKSFFYHYAEQRYGENPEKPMDAIAINIEQFHSVNALKGWSFGNQTLQVLGNEILAFVRKNGGLAGREEADHFSIYCPEKEDWLGLLERLQGKLDTLSPNATIRLRMGVRPWQKDLEPRALFEQARIACSLAKGNFQEHMVVFDDKLQERVAREQRLLNDLRGAVENGEFEVHYQPKYDIQAEPPRLVSAEALVRWRHPRLGMIPPNDFIPLLERNGEISALDKYVWAEATRQIAAWREKYGFTVPVSVNLSRVDVFDPGLENALDRLRESNGLGYKDLKLEVTESAYSENNYLVIDVIERLRRRGYEIEMDDFGTGYSSLSMLSTMPIDVLKMDRGFVSNIEEEEKNLQLVELIMGIARKLNVPVVAEGVETEAQVRLLKELGCAYAQGYYFSRPLPASDFEKEIIEKTTR